MECIFCKIIAGQLPAKVVFQNEAFLAIEDRFPQAKHHVLVLPRKHVTDITQADASMCSGILTAAQDVAKLLGLMPQGFRLAINTGKGGGQTVFHLHVHVMAD